MYVTDACWKQHDELDKLFHRWNNLYNGLLKFVGVTILQKVTQYVTDRFVSGCRRYLRHSKFMKDSHARANRLQFVNDRRNGNRIIVLATITLIFYCRNNYVKRAKP